MEFNYPKPYHFHGFDNGDIAELFDAWIEKLPPGTYLTSQLRNYFYEELTKLGHDYNQSPKSFTQRLNDKGLKANKLARGRCHTKE